MRKHSNVLVLFGLATFVVGIAVVALVLRGGGGSAAASAGDGDARPVLVARQPIAAGTVGDVAVAGGLVEMKQMPGGAGLGSPDDLRGRVFTQNVQPGQAIGLTLLQGRTTHADAVRIPEGKQAVAVRVGFVPGVGGYVGKGDLVNVYGILKMKDGSSLSKLALSNIEVLDVSSQTPASANGGRDRLDGTDLTYLLALDANQAEQVIFLTATQQLYLTLVPKGEQPAVTGGRTLANILN